MMKQPLPSPFDQLPVADLRHLLYESPRIIFHQGTAPRELFFVAKGAVVLERHTQAGQKVVLHRASAGNLIAEASLFSDVYHCDCVVLSGTHLISLKKTSILKRMTEDTSFAMAMMKLLAQQVQRYRRQLELRSIISANDRVLAGILDGWLIGTVMQFANDLGLTHEATYRALAKLVDQGRLYKTGRGKYEITPG